MSAEPLVVHHANCLGCGPDNPASLGLQIQLEGERAFARLRLGPNHEGAPGFAHGGAIATALDDTLGTLLLALGRLAVTASLHVEYRAPVLLGRDLDLEAWCEGIDGRKIRLAGEVREDGRVLAEARALFIEVDRTHFEAGGGSVPGHWWPEG